MYNKDSVGNDLPKSKFVTRNDNLGEALALNTFLLVCKVSLSKGKRVIYDKNTKQATITNKDGFISIVSH